MATAWTRVLQPSVVSRICWTLWPLCERRGEETGPGWESGVFMGTPKAQAGKDVHVVILMQSHSTGFGSTSCFLILSWTCRLWVRVWRLLGCGPAQCGRGQVRCTLRLFSSPCCPWVGLVVCWGSALVGPLGVSGGWSGSAWVTAKVTDISHVHLYTTHTCHCLSSVSVCPFVFRCRWFQSSWTKSEFIGINKAC